MAIYQCSMCKHSFTGEPVFKNNCGVFCADCKATIHARAAKAQKERRKERGELRDGHCIWCGDAITATPKQAGGKNDDNVCCRCRNGRDWLLQAIRWSDRPARYVARTEERERPTREERQRVSQAQLSARNQTQADDTPPSEQEARLLRMERMMNKIMQALN